MNRDELLGELARRQHVIDALMTRVERSMNLPETAFGLLSTAILLEDQVRQRTLEQQEINRQLHAEIEQRQLVEAQLERTSAAKSEFLAHLTHEIRNPMTGVIGMTDLLMTTGLSKHQRDCVELIRKSCEALIKILSQNLDFSKIEAGMVELESVDFDLREWLKDIVGVNQRMAESKGLEMTWQLADDVPERLRGDTMRLRQVVTNLLSNAIKFTARGTVSLSLQVLEQTPSHTRLRFDVKDTGIGIPQERLPQLFAPYAQADSSTSRMYGGTGLGLFIVRQLVEKMGGEVEVSSELDRGSTFWFSVLLERAGDGEAPERRILLPEDTAVAPSTAKPIGGAPERRILLAEDNVVAQLATKKLLEYLGCRVEVAGNGREAVELVNASAYDLVLMDCEMPELDGYQATKQIRDSEGERRHTPIVAMTGHTSNSARRRTIEAGMDEHLTKPITIESARDLLDRWVPTSESTA